MASCSSTIADNITIDCSKPLYGGYSGRAFGIPINSALVVTYDATNPLKIKNVALGADNKGFIIENFGEQPFSGSGSASSSDSGIMRHTKTFQFSVPKRGADVSKNIIDPLTRLHLGFAVIAERLDGTYEAIGFEHGLKVNSDGVTADAYTADGATQIIASCSQYNYEYEFVGASDPLAEFESLLKLSAIGGGLLPIPGDKFS